MRVLKAVRMHIRRSPYQALAAILTMFLTFLVGGFFILTTSASVAVLRYFESKPQLTVFFSEKAPQLSVDALVDRLKNTGKVASTTYISQQEALARYKEQNKNDPLLLEMVTADILPASLEVSATDPKYLSELAAAIGQDTFVDEVVYQRDVVDSLLAWTSAIRTTGIVLALLLAFDSVLIIMTVIAMKIALKREEIEVLMLVGASPWYVRLPFIIEGGVYGVIGAVSASLLLVGIVVWLQPVILSFLGTIPVVQLIFSSVTSTSFIIAASLYVLGLLVVGFLLGAIGSMVSLARFLVL